MLPFQRLFMNGQESEPRAGDRLVYDQKSGTLFIHRDEGDVFFQSTVGETLEPRLFIGRGWSRELTRASAELYARIGGLSGRVDDIEGSFPTLQVFEVRE